MMHNGDPGKWIAGLVGILLAVMGFFFQVQLKTSDRIAEVEKKAVATETDIRYIRSAVERIESKIGSNFRPAEVLYHVPSDK